jgi:hypothetical protein
VIRNALPTWKSAIQQVWKPALRSGAVSGFNVSDTDNTNEFAAKERKKRKVFLPRTCCDGRHFRKKGSASGVRRCHCFQQADDQFAICPPFEGPYSGSRLNYVCGEQMSAR